jgi:hypothetical protein
MAQRFLALILTAALVTPSVARAQTPASPAQVGSDAKPSGSGDLPVSIDRIIEALAHDPTLDLTTKPPMFRLEIVEKKPPSILDFFTTEELKGGPTPQVGAYHQEFLNLTTPRQAQPYGAFSNGELAQALTTSFLSAIFVPRVISAIREAIARGDQEAAREHVRAAIAEWERTNGRRMPGSQ